MTGIVHQIDDRACGIKRNLGKRGGGKVELPVFGRRQVERETQQNLQWASVRDNQGGLISILCVQVIQNRFHARRLTDSAFHRPARQL